MSHAINVRYVLLMVAACGLCAWWVGRLQRGLPLSRRDKFALRFAAFLGAMLGAKLPFALSDWDGLWTGRVWLSDGKTIMFGLVGGYLAVEFTKWALRIKVKTGDTFVVPIAVAVGLGRIACFQAGCCYGIPTALPWGVVFPTAHDPLPLPRHPTQLYEALWHFACAVVFIVLARRDYFPRQRMKAYLLAYLVFRFATEWIRPEQVWWGLFTGYQWSALALFPLFAYLWWCDSRVSTMPLVPHDTSVRHRP